MRQNKALEETRADLHHWLQKALMLELSTIPAYATACYSIKEQGQYDRSAPQIVNAEPIEVIRQVMVEEMLHMVLVANVLNAIGGQPVLNDPELLPRYPHPLLDDKGPTLHLRRFTPEQIKTFREVERGPLDWQNAEKGDYRTIGGFYYWIRLRLDQACNEYGAENIFTGDPERQIEQGDYYGAGGEVIAVKGTEQPGLKETLDQKKKRQAEECRKLAHSALTEIMEEGEGADIGHVACDGDPVPSPEGEERWDIAHFYKFNEILHSRYYLASDRIDTPPSGGDLTVDWNAVWPMCDDPCEEDYRNYPEIAALSDNFNATWTSLLNGLNDAFNGNRRQLDVLIPLMYRLKEGAQRLMRVPLPDRNGETAGPTWRFRQ